MTKKDSSSLVLVPILSIMFCNQFGLSLTFPLLTLLCFDKHSHLFAADVSTATRSFWYGLCLMLPQIINAFSAPILSGLSDHLGRKKILLICAMGIILFALTTGAGIVFNILNLVLLGFIIQGIFSRTNPIGQAIMGDISPREKKLVNMGYLQTAISIGAFLGPILSGYIAMRFFFSKLNFAFAFFVAALIAFFSCLVIIIFFKETFKPEEKSKITKNNIKNNIKKILTNTQVLTISSLLLLCQISWSFYYQFIPPILKTNLHFSADQLGLFIGMIALWLALATTFGIRLLQVFFNMQQILILSFYLVLGGLLLTLLSCQLNLPIFLWLAAIPIAVGDVVGFSCLTSLYSDVVTKSEQGQVMGVCFIVIAFIWALTAMLGGLLMRFSPFLPLMIAPWGVLFAIGLLRRKSLLQVFA